MTGKSVLHNMQAYKPGMQASEVKDKYGLSRIIKLASNENPYGFSSKVTKTLQTMNNDFELYPDGYAGELRTKLSKYLNVAEDQLVFGAGSDEIITFICRAFLEKGTNTVMAQPTFPQYRQHALIEGAEVKGIPTKEGHHDLEEMLAAIDENTKIVWLCTPDNPTGSIISEEAFIAFMTKCPSDVVVVLDEAYYEFMEAEDQFDLHRHLAAYPNLIVLRTFSKAYGLAGFRVGYGISSKEIADKLNIVRGPFNVTVPSQRIAMTALDDQAFIADTVEKNRNVRANFQHFLDDIGWMYYPSETNFLLVATPIEADKAAEFLLKEGFIVRSGDLLGYPKTLRITIGTAETMHSLEQAISKLNKLINDGVLS